MVKAKTTEAKTDECGGVTIEASPDLTPVVLDPHPWNINPLPPRNYRLVMTNRHKENNELIATSTVREALSDLEAQLTYMDYEFVRLERLEDTVKA